MVSLVSTIEQIISNLKTKTVNPTTMLFNLCESELIAFLKDRYKNKISISESDKIEMKEYETGNYALLGIIGLIMNNKPRILLGRKQFIDQEIREMCQAVPVLLSDLENIADKYLDDDFEDDSEFILRSVMLEYPKER